MTEEQEDFITKMLEDGKFSISSTKTSEKRARCVESFSCSGCVLAGYYCIEIGEEYVEKYPELSL